MGRPPSDYRRDAILACIESSWLRRGRGPTYREIAAEIGLTSLSGVVYHLRILAEAGCVTMQPRTSGSLQVVTDL